MDKLAEYSDRDGYFFVRVLVPWTTDSAKSVIDATNAEATVRGYHRILFDLTFWEKPDNVMTRFWSGEYLASQMRAPFKVAAFALPKAINWFGESAAINRGAIFRLFKDEESAIEWLM